MTIPLFMLLFAHAAYTSAQAGAGTLPASGWTMPATFEIVQGGCFSPIKLTGLSFDGAAVTGGRAELVCNSSAAPMYGKVSGNMAGNFVQLVIDWGCIQRPWPLDCRQTVGIYEGDVKPDGRVEGTTFDRSEPGSRATWHGAQALQRK